MKGAEKVVNIGNDWDEVLKGEFEKDYYLKLRNFLKSEYKYHTIYPDMYDIFNALKWTSYADTKVVILDRIHIMKLIRHMVLLFLYKRESRYRRRSLIYIRS